MKKATSKIVTHPSPPGTRNPEPGTRNAGFVGFAILSSRILGLVREQVFAILFGAGLEYDAFVTAFRIPNLLRDLFSEGGLSTAFVTVFSQKLAKHGEAALWTLVNRVLHVLLLLAGLVVLAGVWFQPQLMELIAPGFGAIPGKAELTVGLARLMWPFVGMVFLASLLMGTLNAREQFAAPSFASASFNVGAIFGGLACAGWLAPEYVFGMARVVVGLQRPDHLDTSHVALAIFGMAVGTLIGGTLQIVIQLPGLWSAGYRYAPTVSMTDPDVRRVLWLFLPAVIGGAATQINVFINTYFASELGNGPVGWLNYSFRLIQFPIGIFGVAIATTTFPAMARAASRQDFTDLQHQISQALGLVMVLCIPSACGLAVLGKLIVAVIYEHGKFTAVDTQATASALGCYALGLTGYAAIKVLAPVFYALHDTRTPVLLSIGSVLLNFGFNYLLVRVFHFGHTGLALSTAGVILVEFVILAWLLKEYTRQRLEGAFWVGFLKILVASAFLSATAWGCVSFWQFAGFWLRCLQLMIAIGVSSLVFALACRLLRIREFDFAVEAFLGKVFKSY